MIDSPPPAVVRASAAVTAYSAVAFLAVGWLALAFMDAPKTDGFERYMAKFYAAGFGLAALAVVAGAVHLQKMIKKRDPNVRGNVTAILFLGSIVPLFGFPSASWLLLGLALAVLAGFVALMLSRRAARNWYVAPDEASASRRPRL
jgi:hypothetical protein